MTEDDAKTKWCPFARALYQGQSPDGTLCIASACMAWRWDEGPTDTAWSGKDEPAPGPEWSEDPDYVGSSDDRFGRKWLRPKPDRLGYCGLAGAQP